MCGIVAVYTQDKRPLGEDLLVSMRDSMVHRGPDDAGVYLDQHVALGHRRLSIIDRSGGHQPMPDHSGTVWIVFNGEIYNFLSLRDELANRGYRFKTRSDTEVILALYAYEGERFVDRLNGIFAFALWDSKKNNLYLVRDRMGVKPLYIYRGKCLVAAASEIKALLKHPQIKGEVHDSAIPEYLAFRQLCGNKTMFKGIEQVGPGQMMVITPTGATTRTYWPLPRCTHENIDGIQYEEQIDRLLSEATQMQMVADVPLGTFNSGGLDSSLVTVYAAEKASGRLNTFSVGFSDSNLDERPYAEMVTRELNTNHRSLVIENQEYAENLPQMIWHHDEPLSHPHTIQLYLLSKFTKQFVTVVLTGEGADELFAGYPRYRSGAALQLLGGPGQWLAQHLVSILPDRPASRFQKAKRALQLGPLGTVIETARWVTDAQLNLVLESEASPIKPERFPRHPLNGDLVASMLEQDQRNYLQAILMRLDKATMGASVEARVPFLDHRLVELAATIPSSQKLRRFETKYPIKRLAIQYLPKEIVHRRKMGFPVPLSEWFRDPLGLGRFLDLLVEPRSLQRGYLKPQSVRKIVDEHRRGGKDYGELLWGLVNLEVWHRVMIEYDSIENLSL